MRQQFWNARFAWLLYGLFAIVMAYSWMSPEITAPNERTRIYLSLSMLESGSIRVDEQVKVFGKPFDISEREGHFYTDKAPGSSVIALPFVAFYKAVGGDMGSIEKMTNFTRTFMMVPLALLTLFLIRYLILGLGVAPAIANRTVVAFALGTSFLHYGAVLYGHALITLLSVGAAAAMSKSVNGAGEERKSLLWIALAGFCAGMAFAVEYQAVVVFIGLFLGFLMVPEYRRVKPVLALGLGTVGPVAAALWYNFAAFGHPFATSYDNLHHQSSQSNHDHGFFGIELPSVETLYGLLISPARGLLVCAPLVLLGIFGLGLLWRRSRWLAVYCGVTIAFYVFMVAGGKDFWFGGWSFGPRLLVPMYGLAALGGALACEKLEARGGAIAGALGGVLVAAIFYNVFVFSMFPELPFEFSSPFKSVAIPLAGLGTPSPNIGMTLLGLSGMWSLVPLMLIIVGLCGYLVWPLIARREHRLAALVAMIVSISVFFVFVVGYPEKNSRKNTENFVSWVSKLRIEPR